MPKDAEYIEQDNLHLRENLQQELEGLHLNGSTYAWQFKSAQQALADNKDENELNIFFLGTSSTPIFSRHNVDLCETGHVLCQAAYQKAKQGKSAVIVKGIATLQMDDNYPLDALDNPDIASGGPGLETAMGTGANHRLQVAMESYVIPNLFTMLSNKPLAERDNIMINISGHSRGGITTFLMADTVNRFLDVLINGEPGYDYDLEDLAQKYELSAEKLQEIISDIKDNHEKVKLKVCALDPVEGKRSLANPSSTFIGKDAYKPVIPLQLTGINFPMQCSYSEMPARVSNACVLFAADERRTDFRATIPSFASDVSSEQTSQKTQVIFKQVHGKHGGLTGNFGNDAGDGQFSYRTFNNEERFRQSIKAVFDQTLNTINLFNSQDGKLPPFPRNTLRRIINEQGYTKTNDLLRNLQVECLKDQDFQKYLIEHKIISSPIEFSLNSDAKKYISQLERQEPDKYLDFLEAMMLYQADQNIILYNALNHEAAERLEKARLQINRVKREWRQDTSAVIPGYYSLALDEASEQRQIYIRGKKEGGAETYETVPLSSLANVGLPNFLYDQPFNESRIRFFEPTQISKQELDLAIQHFRAKMEMYSGSQNIDKLVLIDDFKDLLHKFNLATIAPDGTRIIENNAYVHDQITKLIVDLDFRHHLLSKEGIINLIKETEVFHERKIESTYNRLENKYATNMLYKLEEYGLNNLQPDEMAQVMKHLQNFHCILAQRPEANLQSKRLLEKIDEQTDKIAIKLKTDACMSKLREYIQNKPASKELDQILASIGMFTAVAKNLKTHNASQLAIQLQKALDALPESSNKEFKAVLKHLETVSQQVDLLKQSTSYEIHKHHNPQLHLEDVLEDYEYYIDGFKSNFINVESGGIMAWIGWGTAQGDDADKDFLQKLESLRNELQEAVKNLPKEQYSNQLPKIIKENEFKLNQVIDNFIETTPYTSLYRQKATVKHMVQARENRKQYWLNEAQNRLEQIHSASPPPSPCDSPKSQRRSVTWQQEANLVNTSPKTDTPPAPEHPNVPPKKKSL